MAINSILEIKLGKTNSIYSSTEQGLKFINPIAAFSLVLVNYLCKFSHALFQRGGGGGGGGSGGHKNIGFPSNIGQDPLKITKQSFNVGPPARQRKAI